MYGGHLRCVLRQQLPEKPTSAQFLAGLAAALDPPQGPAPDEALFGDMFSMVGKVRGGQKKTQNGAVKALLDFQKVMEKNPKPATIENLDDFFTAFAKWCLNVECLFDNKEKQEEALAQRKELCANAGVKVRAWLPSSLRTHLNGAAALYKTAEGKGSVVPSEESLFPNYCAIFSEAYRRERDFQARKPEVAVLNDEEVEKLYDSTNWLSPFEAQRTNLLILCYQLGQRPDSLEDLCVGNFHRQTTEDNSLEVLVKFGNMKNLGPKQQ